MKTYLKRNYNGYYIAFEEELNPDYVGDGIGSTYQDFLDGKWVLLSDEQVAFHINHPSASVHEVISMQMNEVHVDLVEQARYQKEMEIRDYDASDAVNGFTVNNVLSAWFTPEERSNYKNSIDSAKLLGVESLSLLVSGNVITLDVQTASLILASIQLYADACYMVTQQHLSNIQNLNSVEDIEGYDHTAGYPSKLNFDVTIGG